MPLPNSGAITTAQIAAEFNITGSYTWSDLCAAAGLSNTALPSDFYGLSSELQSVSVDTTFVSGTCMYTNPQTSCTSTSSSVTATPNGGSGHSYTWQKVSGTTLTVTSPNSATTTFKRTSGSSASAVYRCRVVAGGVTKYSPNVSVTMNNGQIH